MVSIIAKAKNLFKAYNVCIYVNNYSTKCKELQLCFNLVLKILLSI